MPHSNSKKFKIKFATLVLFLLSSTLTPSPLNSAGMEHRVDLTLMYTASLNGNLDGCNCPKIRRAGLVKRAHYLRRLARRRNMLLVDAGDLFETGSGDKQRAAYILQTYRDLKYDAVGVGDNELSGGILSYREKFPWIANNLHIFFDSGTTILANEPLVLTKGGYRVGIFALLEPQFISSAPVTDLISKKFQIAPVTETALKMVQFLNARKTRLNILLYHGFYKNAVKLAETVSGIDLIILGHEEKLLDLQMINRTGIVSPGEAGNRIGILEISLANRRVVFIKNQFRLFNYETDPDDPQVRKLIDKYYKNNAAPLEPVRQITKPGTVR